MHPSKAAVAERIAGLAQVQQGCVDPQVLFVPQILVGPGNGAAREIVAIALETEFIAEFLSVESGRAAAEGELAELVLTNLGRIGCPVIRYRTGDLVQYSAGLCACGSSEMALEGGILAAILTSAFAPLLQKFVTLALFVPVVLGLGESVAIQSVTLALLVLHKQRPTLAALANRLRHELLTGALLVAACGIIMALVSFGWLGLPKVALSVLAGIGVGVAGSAMFGLSMPYLLRLLKRDPQVAAGPIALVLADMLSLFMYFGVAQSLLG